MQLQGGVAVRRGKKAYEKFWIVIPAAIVKKLGWKKGDQITHEEKDTGLLLKKQK